MRVAVIVPVGPGHASHGHEAAESVCRATVPPGWSVETVLVDDTEGELGRSRARNLGAEESESDWIFWLDADDSLTERAFLVLQDWLERVPTLDALWGPVTRHFALWGSGKTFLQMRTERMSSCHGPISTFDELVSWSDGQTIHSGCFVRRRVHERVGGWLECIDLAEDTEYAWACAAHSREFRKQVDEPLFLIRSDLDSSEGPRGLPSPSDRSGSVVMRRRGPLIAAYWRARGKVPWTRAEKARRGSLYGDLGPAWRGEPYVYQPSP